MKLSTPNSIWRTAAILGLLGILTRLPFQSQILSEHDAANFALALTDFDVRLHQPHPPGTFVFLIFLGRLFNLFLHDANQSLVSVSILASGIAAAATFVLSASWFGRFVAWVSGLLMLSSPLVWFYGEVALSYMLEYAWVLLLAIACFRLRLGDKIAFFVAAVMMGLAGGIRPNTPVFLFPLWSIAVALGMRESKYSWRQLILALLLMAGGVALWAVPMVAMSGGVTAYWQAIGMWLDRHLEDVDNIWGMLNNAIALLKALLFCVGLGFFPLLWVLGKERKSRLSRVKQDWRVQTLILWIAPGAAYLIFIHFQRQGHTFTIMPAFVLLCGFAIGRCGQYLARLHRPVGIIIAAIVISCNSLFFLLGPGELRTWTKIRQHDSFVKERVEAIRDRFPASQTVVLTRGSYARILNFYLDDYQETSLSHRLQTTPTVLPPQVRTLVLFDERILSRLAEDPGFARLPLPSGETLRYISWNANQQVKVSKVSLDVHGDL